MALLLKALGTFLCIFLALNTVVHQWDKCGIIRSYAKLHFALVEHPQQWAFRALMEHCIVCSRPVSPPVASHGNYKTRRKHTKPHILRHLWARPIGTILIICSITRVHLRIHYIHKYEQSSLIYDSNTTSKVKRNRRSEQATVFD